MPMSTEMRAGLVGAVIGALLSGLATAGVAIYQAREETARSGEQIQAEKDRSAEAIEAERKLAREQLEAARPGLVEFSSLSPQGESGHVPRVVRLTGTLRLPRDA